MAFPRYLRLAVAMSCIFDRFTGCVVPSTQCRISVPAADDPKSL